MKLNKRTLHQQRRQLDEKLKPWKALADVSPPRYGWLKVIRESLGITSRQLAKILDTDNAGILRIEKREAEQKITLAMLDQTAKAMGCKLVYALVPKESLESILDQKAEEAATKLMQSVSNTMRLEKQEITPASKQAQLKDLIQELKTKLDPLLWEKIK